MDSAKFIFAYFQGDPCLVVLDHKVKASMRNDEYCVECAFTLEHFVASTCECKAGFRNESLHKLGMQRVLCTHGLVPLVQLSLLFFKYLAVNLLYKLRIRLVNDEDAFLYSDVTREAQEKFKQALECLIFAATKEVVSLDASKSLSEWLVPFQVGTKKAKRPQHQRICKIWDSCRRIANFRVRKRR